MVKWFLWHCYIATIFKIWAQEVWGSLSINMIKVDFWIFALGRGRCIFFHWNLNTRADPGAYVISDEAEGVALGRSYSNRVLLNDELQLSGIIDLGQTLLQFVFLHQKLPSLLSVVMQKALPRKSRILVQVMIYRRLLIARDGLSTNQKLTLYRNFYENMDPGL